MLYLKIWWHKRQARKVYNELCSLICNYPCGIHMLNEVTGGEYDRLVNEYNKHVYWLKSNDKYYPHK